MDMSTIYLPHQPTNVRLIIMRFATLTAVSALLWAAFLPVTTHALADTTSTNQDDTVQVSEVASALAHTNGVLGASDQTKTTTDADSAIQAATAGATVDIPKDASDGVSLGGTASAAPAIDISLPNAGSAKDAKQVAPGTVAYAGTNGSAEAVQATEDGGVRMLTVIDNPDAPTTYDYKVTVPNGGHIQIATDGSAVILDNNNQVLATIATPWAKDATGKQIQTYFTTNGQTLTQHILHNVPSTVYPVTADPKIIWGWSGVTVVLTQLETHYLAIGAVAALSARVGGAIAVGITAAGGQWLADQADKRHLCVAGYKSYIGWQYSLYLTRCP